MAAFVVLLSLSGCDDSGLEKAEQEARRAKATVSALELNIAKSEQTISDLKEDLIRKGAANSCESGCQ